MYKIPSNKILLLFFAPAIFLFIILLLSGQNFIFSLFIILIYGIFSIAFINNKIGLFLLILLRPCLDYFGGQSTVIAGMNLNFADIFAILTIAFCFYTIAKNLHRVKSLPLLRSWLFFLIALSASPHHFHKHRGRPGGNCQNFKLNLDFLYRFRGCGK